MVDCIARIRVDVLKIWNFNDPLEVSCALTYWGKQKIDIRYKILSGDGFLEGMIKLVEPLSDEVIRNQPERWVALQRRE